MQISSQHSFRSRSPAETPEFIAVTLRSIGNLVDLQLSAARALFHTQARALAAFGWPDISGLFPSRAGAPIENVFASGVEQWLETTRRFNEAFAEVQRQVGRVAGSQVFQASRTWQRGLEELGTQAQAGLTQIVETTREQAEQAERANESLGSAARETLRQGSEQIRERVQEGFQQGRSAIAQTGEVARQGAESLRQSAQKVGEAASGDEKQRKALVSSSGA